MKLKVFVSYSTKDASQVARLQEVLDKTPIEVFVAEEAIDASQDLSFAISKAIEQCDLFVLLWGINAEKSGWVLQEVGQATAYKKSILPLVLEEGVALPVSLQHLKHLNVGGGATALEEARRIIVQAYERKANTAAEVQAERDKLALFGIGAFLFWVFSK